VWSESAFLAWVFHSGLAAEIARDAALHVLAAGGSAAEVQAAIARLDVLAPADAPGRRALLDSLKHQARSDQSKELP
jgi:hypothetical protein